MRDAANVRTICEVLREINDLHQGAEKIDSMTRALLAEAENMAKKMSVKLVEYNKKVYAGWWKKNPDYERDLKKRLNEKYICG